ncbi:MAG: cory-CC-star protein [Pseudomonadales bacterium]|nr:cory-CC-star protein [Pseudomonadales bacterium]
MRDNDASNNKDKGAASGSSEASLFARVESGLKEFYVAPYRQAFARAQRDEDDLFMLMIFSETLGIPNPASYYTLELLPVVYERFHDWHRRMGMEHSPLDHVQCC